jgi:hypothetical protein
MALITGKDCDLKIATKSYSGVVNKFELKFDMSSVSYQTLTGPLAAGGTETGTLDITFAYDSGTTDSLFDALWDASGKPLDYIAKIGDSIYTGKAIAVRPGANAEAGAVSEVTVSMNLDGIPTKGKPAGTK